MRWLLLTALCILGCTEDEVPLDAGQIDAAVADAALEDVGVADSGVRFIDGFTRIVRGGIDDRLNGYPWAMELFDGDQDGQPEIYVGTVQNPLCLQVGLAGMLSGSSDLPPERWQCRNDLWGNWALFFAASSTPGHIYRGVHVGDLRFAWQRVFSPSLTETSGFRGARVFDGAIYFLGMTRTDGVVWKSTDGLHFERASPEGLAQGGRVVAGGLRGAQVFRGQLYLANNGIAEIYTSAAPSTSTASWQQVNSTGFVQSGGETDARGQPYNTGFWQLGVWRGHLYAGTTNAERGAELWKSSDPRPGNWTRVIEGGFGNQVPDGFMTIRSFNDHLYLGTVLYPVTSTVYEGAEILRLNERDEVELLVGKTRSSTASRSGMTGGFDYPPNLYAWYMAEYDEWLYVGSYDAGSQVIDYAEITFGAEQASWTEENRATMDTLLGTTDRRRQGGADLWRTQDGEQWEAVNLDGFGDRDNYGIRNMLVTPWGLMVATGNTVDGFEIWLLPR